MPSNSIRNFLISILAIVFIAPTLAGADASCFCNCSCNKKKITPNVKCIDDLPNGNVVAHFGYVNLGAGRTVALGTNNYITPDAFTPFVITNFSAGTIAEAFPVEFNPSEIPTVTWTVEGASASASFDSPLCMPNQLPVCNFGQGTLTKACSGETTLFTLDATGSIDPDGGAVSYEWTSDCADATITSPTSLMTTISLTGPGQGVPASCKVTLKVTDRRSSVSCERQISVPACEDDCLGVPGGSAMLDACGVCNGNNACVDCLGVVNGTAVVDQCGVCNGSNACVDCKGVVNGLAKKDQCGVCEGDGTSCLGCSDVNVRTLLFALDGNAHEQAFLVRRAVGKVLATNRPAPGVRRALKKLVRQSTDLYTLNWTLAWSLPDIVSKCTNEVLCTTVDNSGIIKSYLENAATLRDMVAKVFAEANLLTDKRAISLIGRAKKKYQKAQEYTANVPPLASDCIGPAPVA